MYILLSKYSHWIVYTLNNIYIDKPYISGIVENLRNKIKEHYKNYVRNKQTNIIRESNFIDKTLLIVVLLVKFLQIMGFNSKSDFYNFLFHQLKIFEKDFGFYINEEECNNQEYISNVKDIIRYIKDNNGNNQNIISFNYTDLTKIPGCKPIRNVHATFSYHPIIGIDSSRGSAFEKPYYMFTKTYRTLRLINRKNEGINSNEYFQNILPKRSDLKKLIFYGHSLGIEDYSYFMAIFDYYHIYDSDVKLVFYFNYYNGATNNQIKRNQYIQIFKLINHYGASINHGENLLHKLILENRIHIEYMPKGIGRTNN